MTKPSPDRPRNANIETLHYNEDSVERIAAILDVSLDVAPFRMPGSNVWQLTIPGTDGRASVLLTLWTGLKRVDAISGLNTVVFNEVELVDLVPGVEVQFRTSRRSMLIVARQGNVIVRAS
jgi:hypothetical protein